MASFRSRVALHIEVLALRHQLTVMQRSVKRPRLTATDRFFWAWLAHVWRDWRSALVMVKPETVVGWHRRGFRLFWTWKVRRGQPGRPVVPADVRQLIRKMSRENPLWGAPRNKLYEKRIALARTAEAAEGAADGGSGLNARYAFFGIKDVMEGRTKFALAEAANELMRLKGSALILGGVTAGVAAIGFAAYETYKHLQEMA